MKLESIVLKATATIIVVLALSGCGQDDITLPDAGSSAAVGECGAWYPGGGGDGGVTYGFDVGDTLPCFVWESVRIGEQGDEPNAYLSMGELYLMAAHEQTDLLQAKFGLDEAKSLVIAISAMSCSQCPDFLGAIVDLEGELNQLGAIPIGVCRHDLNDLETPLSLETADNVLLNHDHWPEDWYRTNDAEYLLPSVPPSPHIYCPSQRHEGGGLQRRGNFGIEDKLISTLQSLDSY